MTLYKKVPRKKFSYFGKYMETKDVYNYGNMNLILKTPLAIFNMQMDRKKFFYENFPKTWDPFFFRTLIPEILFPKI